MTLEISFHDVVTFIETVLLVIGVIVFCVEQSYKQRVGSLESRCERLELELAVARAESRDALVKIDEANKQLNLWTSRTS